MKLDEIVTHQNQLWRYYPDLFAKKVTRGRWKPYNYLQYISERIRQKVANPDGKILLIEAPPRHGKSEFISATTPAWFLEQFPEKSVIHASYAAELSAGFGRRVRNLVNDRQDILSFSLADDSSSASNWHTNYGGGMFTSGVGGPLTGKGGHLMLIDDPVKNWEEAASPTIQERNVNWFDSTFYTRAEPGAVIIVLMTRWHKKDLASHIETNYPCEKITFKAIAEEADVIGRSLGDSLCPERFDIDKLLEIKKNISPRFWTALYQQSPTSEEGAIIQRSWIKFYGPHQDCEIKFTPQQLLGFNIRMVQSWDMTFKDTVAADYVVGQAWLKKEANIFLIDQIRDKLSFTETIAAFKLFSDKHPRAVKKLVEEKANGAAVIDSLKMKIQGIVPIRPKDSKESRLNAVSPLWQAGNIWLPHPSIATFDVMGFIEEVVGFGSQPHDDQVDAMTQALDELGGASGYSLEKMVKS